MSQTIITGVARGSVLVDLTIRTYTGRKQDKSTQEEVQHAKGAASRRAASVYKSLFAECRELDAITKFQASVRTAHYKLTLPWADKGSRLLPIRGLQSYQDRMNMYRAEFDTLVARFLDRYDLLVAAAAFQLGTLFDRSEYPTREKVASKFSIDVSLSPLPTAGDFRIDAEADLQRDLMQQYEEQATQRVVAAQRDAWNRLHTTLKHMADRLTDEDGKKNRIFDTLIDNPRELCGLLTMLNVTNDPALERARVQLENLIEGTSVSELRKFPDERAHVKSKVEGLLSQFDWGTIDDDAEAE
jgi:hypothetical protein